MNIEPKGLWRFVFPYCICRMQSGKWTLLNRFYKPIGTMDTKKHYDYNEYSLFLELSKSDINFLASGEKTPEKARFVNVGETVDMVWLYGDCSNPDCGKKHKELYLKKLELLMMKQIKQDD